MATAYVTSDLRATCRVFSLTRRECRVVMHGAGLILLALLGGCDALRISPCTDISIPGIRVSVIDSVTGAAVAGEGRVIASDGAYSDTVSFTGTPSVLGVAVVEDRPGVYAVQVTAAGYALWERRNVLVSRADRCHVQSVSLTARLAR